MKICKHPGCDNPVKPPSTTGVSTYNECARCKNLRYRYGITGPDADYMLASQGSVCKCCDRPIQYKSSGGQASTSCAVVDHVENPFKIRGIICGNCNVAIGKLGDNEEGLARALAYVKGIL